MNQDSHFEDISSAIQSFDGRDIQISPQSRYEHHQNKLFCSPFHVGEFTQLPKVESSSPELQIEFCNSFRRIMENQHQESEDNQQFDVMGNRINQFDSKCQIKVEEEGQLSPIQEDKQNQRPKSYLNTPLKLRRSNIRSPLQDITPSMTHKKKKTDSKLTVSAKLHLLTPRTMQKSGLASSGLRKIQRF